jgi:hypothetical protein
VALLALEADRLSEGKPMESRVHISALGAFKTEKERR